MNKPITTETVIRKVQELDKVQEQVARGLITIREALNQRVRVLTDAKEMLSALIDHDLNY